MNSKQLLDNFTQLTHTHVDVPDTLQEIEKETERILNKLNELFNQLKQTETRKEARRKLLGFSSLYFDLIKIDENVEKLPHITDTESQIRLDAVKEKLTDIGAMFKILKDYSNELCTDLK